MPRFVKLLSTTVLEDELLLLHACAMLSQASHVPAAILFPPFSFLTHSRPAALQKSRSNGA
jgi:hypothetical protein